MGSKIAREQGACCKYVHGAGSIKEIIQEAGRKGSNFERSRELGTPLTGSHCSACHYNGRTFSLVSCHLVFNKT